MSGTIVGTAARQLHADQLLVVQSASTPVIEGASAALRELVPHVSGNYSGHRKFELTRSDAMVGAIGEARDALRGMETITTKLDQIAKASGDAGLTNETSSAVSSVRALSTFVDAIAYRIDELAPGETARFASLTKLGKLTAGRESWNTVNSNVFQAHVLRASVEEHLANITDRTARVEAKARQLAQQPDQTTHTAAAEAAMGSLDEIVERLSARGGHAS